jgi:cytochrome P450
MIMLSYFAVPFVLYFAIHFIVKQAYLSLTRIRFINEHGCLPAEKKPLGGDPILGLSFLLETIRRAKNSEYMQCALERFRLFGTTYVNKRLLYETISTIDPENVKAVVLTNFDDFQMPDIRLKAMKPLFGDGIFVNDGPKWAHFRGLLRPIFTRQSMAPLLSMTERHFQVLLRRLPTNGTTCDLRELFYDFTLDTATEFLLGSSTHTLDPEHSTVVEAQFASDYLACCREAVNILQLGPLHWLSRKSKLRVERDRAWAFVDRYVDETLRLRDLNKMHATTDLDRNSDDYNLLSELARDTDNRDLLRAQILNVLLASRDTTAALLGNLFFMLARHPEAYAKLRDEVLAHVGHGLPTEAHLKAMTWLRYCINECRSPP